MLAYLLAVLVGTGSVGLYTAAFFFPQIHRKYDFIWSGVGFFYALVLWIYARQFTGGILIGQTASIALLGWLAWQTVKLRRQLAPTNQPTSIPDPVQMGLKQSAAQPAAPAKSRLAQTPSTSIPPQPAPDPKVVAPRPPQASPASIPLVQPAPDPKVVAPRPPQAPPTSIPPVQPAPEPKVVAPRPPPAPPASIPPVQPAPEPKVVAPRPPQAPPASIPPVQPRLSPAQEVAPVRPPQTPPTASPTPDSELEEAWITLEVKPASATQKPLGQAVKPPTLPEDV